MRVEIYETKANLYSSGKKNRSVIKMVKVVGHHETPEVCTAVSIIIQTVGSYLQYHRGRRDTYLRSHEQHNMSDDVWIEVVQNDDDPEDLVMMDYLALSLIDLCQQEHIRVDYIPWLNPTKKQ